MAECSRRLHIRCMCGVAVVDSSYIRGAGNECPGSDLDLKQAHVCPVFVALPLGLRFPTLRSLSTPFSGALLPFQLAIGTIATGEPGRLGKLQGYRGKYYQSSSSATGAAGNLASIETGRGQNYSSTNNKDQNSAACEMSTTPGSGICGHRRLCD